MFQWTDNLSIGVKEIDDDHKRILQYMSDFIGAIHNDRGTFHIEGIFQQLLDYTAYHFKREEAVMKICSYKRLSDHQKSHASLITRLEELRTQYMQTPDKTIDSDMQSLLEDWLITHIIKEDVPLRAVVKKNLDKLKEAGF